MQEHRKGRKGGKGGHSQVSILTSRPMQPPGWGHTERGRSEPAAARPTCRQSCQTAGSHPAGSAGWR